VIVELIVRDSIKAVEKLLCKESVTKIYLVNYCC